MLDCIDSVYKVCLLGTPPTHLSPLVQDLLQFFNTECLQVDSAHIDLLLCVGQWKL